MEDNIPTGDSGADADVDFAQLLVRHGDNIGIERVDTLEDNEFVLVSAEGSTFSVTRRCFEVLARYLDLLAHIYSVYLRIEEFLVNPVGRFEIHFSESRKSLFTFRKRSEIIIH